MEDFVHIIGERRRARVSERKKEKRRERMIKKRGERNVTKMTQLECTIIMYSGFNYIDIQGQLSAKRPIIYVRSLN